LLKVPKMAENRKNTLKQAKRGGVLFIKETSHKI